MSYEYRKQFISFPDGPFFLRHVVMMNYAGKVYSVLRGIEVAVQSEAQLEQALFITYAVCMTLGMYWYTRFWLREEDLEAYYSEKDHALTDMASAMYITLGAAIYYALFAVLFLVDYSVHTTPAAISLGLWNVWCCANLLLASRGINTSDGASNTTSNGSRPGGPGSGRLSNSLRTQRKDFSRGYRSVVQRSGAVVPVGIA